ncbi:hypothetical protein [Sphingopyxis sp.]|uniref:hypothetical protein n=1 Tax=Sphingopyxis sp. TaxID=1908224 RepID=UPI001DD417A4|nr:hypothetical protein [Sphingopyxis sp.]MBW8296210.1 hypothetical protein [Sphingopyxis sp.]
MTATLPPLTPERLDELRALRGAWSTSRAAAGGLAAMAGFNFQLTLSIAAIIEQEIAGEGTAYIEALSDLMRAERGIVITQAKRTMSSAALHSALGELWQIYQLAAQNTPGLLPLLRFEVASALRTLADWEASLERWLPEEGVSPGLVQFKSRLAISVRPDARQEAARLLVNAFKDPDPFARIDRMLGALLSAPGHALDPLVDSFRLELRALRERSHELEMRFALWGSGDRSPRTVERAPDGQRAVRLGERLTVSDLREGRLANRAIYDDVERGCETWLAAEREPYKLPMFWLAGRSGCGKSAALLHLAARLHAQNPDRILLNLGERVDRIAEAVRWAAPRIREGRTVILLLDDPFTAARQQAFARAVEEAQLEWENVRASAPNEDRRPPAIICCGPTEQRDAAEDQCGSHIACDGFALPIETAADLAELAIWYEARTGTPVAPMTGNILLVQQIFEWAKGSIADFSARFRDRIQTFDDGRKDGPVFSAIAQILALNRLYVDFPADHLAAMRHADPDLDAALITLGEEQAHLDFNAGIRGGVRLTHPHLADAIYMQWFGRATDRPYRKRHLSEALVAAVGQQNELPEIRHAPLWAIARLAQYIGSRGGDTDPAIGQRISAIQTELGQVLSDVYRERADSATPLEDLPIWVALRDSLGLTLTPDPLPLLVAAVDAAEVPARGLRLSCHYLLTAKGDTESYHACVARCLNRLIAWRDVDGAWRDWVPVAIDFMLRAGHAPILASIASLVATGTSLPRMPQLIFMLRELPDRAGRPILLDWLQRTQSSQPGWSKLLQRLQDDGQCSDSDAIAQRFIAAARNDERWAFIWLNLLAGKRVDRSTLVDEGLSWIGIARPGFGQAANPINFGWDRVWQQLLVETYNRPAEYEQLLQIGLAWIQDIDPDHNGWTRVWPALWSHAFESDDPILRRDLLTLAESKLSLASPVLLGWSHIWNAVVDNAEPEILPYLLRLGSAFLREAPPDHFGWGFVWQKMLMRAGDTMRPQLIARGRQWTALQLFANPSWPFVWRDIVTSQAEPGDPLLPLGLSWLESPFAETMVWPNVALRLLSARNPDLSVQVPRLAIPWLKDRTDHAIWYALFRECRKAGFTASEVADLVAHFTPIVADPAAVASARGCAWDALRALGVPRTLLDPHALAIVQMADTPEDIQRNICGRMLRSTTNSALRKPHFDHALGLLATTDNVKVWNWLWDSMRENMSAHEKQCLSDRLPDLLKRSPLSDKQWVQLLPRAAFLNPAIGKDDAIQARALRWLAAASAQPYWIKIWRAIGEPAAPMTDPALRRCATANLKSALQEPAWAMLWRAVFRFAEPGEHTLLVQLARPWLTNNMSGRGWHSVWDLVHQAEVAAGGDTGALKELGINALKATAGARRWSVLFQTLRQLMPERLNDQEILGAADLWLSEPRGPSRVWLDVLQWRRAFGGSPWDNARARDNILRWLKESNGNMGPWTRIWTDVVKTMPALHADETRELGFAWLGKAATSHPSWPYIWATLWKLPSRAPQDRPRLREIGAKWLAAKPGHPRVAIVADRLRGSAPLRRKGKTPGVTTGGR